MDDDRMPPHDLDAEEAVLGSCLIDGEAIDKISFLEPDHFYRDKNQWVFEAIVTLQKRGDSINQITVAHELGRVDRLEDLGGSAYLANLIMNVPTSVHVDHYSRIVWRLSGHRRIIKAGGKISDVGYEDRPTVSEALSLADEEIAKLQVEYAMDDDRTSYHEQGMHDYIETQADATIKPWLTTPWSGYNDMVRLRNGKATTIAAPSGMGKTIVCEQIIEHCARDLGKNGLYLFNELDPSDFYNRRACRLMTTKENRAPKLSDLEDGVYAQSDEMSELVSSVMNWPGKTTLVDCTGWDVYRIRSEIKQKAAMGLADFVILDYIQLIPSTGKGNRAREIGFNFQLLKQTCRSVAGQPPFIAVSQTNRPQHQKGEGRQLKKADFTLDSLRDSGEIGDYSNVVTFVFNKWDATNGDCYVGCTFNKGTYEPDICLRRCAFLITVKNTFGRKGDILVRQIPHRFKFVDHEKQEQLDKV